MDIKKNILPTIIFLVLNFIAKDQFTNEYAWIEFYKHGLKDQKTHEVMTELGTMNIKNSGVVWYGCYSYFNEYPVLDLMYKTRDCKGIKNRGEFYPGHNKYDFLKDTPQIIVGMIWKPNKLEFEFLKSHYKVFEYKGIKIFQKGKQ